MADFPTVELRFADGTTKQVRKAIAHRVVGLDPDGDVLVPLGDGILNPVGDGPWLVPLTPCCNADGKGSYPGTVCRMCYRECDPKHGSWEELTVEVVR